MKTIVGLMLGVVLAATTCAARSDDFVMLGLTPQGTATSIATQFTTCEGIPFSLDYGPDGELLWEFCRGVRCPGIEEYDTSGRLLPTSSRVLLKDGLVQPYARIHVLQNAAYAIAVPEGSVAGYIVASYSDGTCSRFPLVVGQNTAEWAWDRVENQGCLDHTRPDPAFSWRTSIDSAFEYDAHLFLASFPLSDKPLVGIEIAIEQECCDSRQTCGDEFTTWFALFTSAVTLELLN